MKIRGYMLLLLIGSICLPQITHAQVDFNKRPTDDLGNVEDQFQEYFFEALKQKGIENYQKSVDALLKCIGLDDTKAVLYYELGKNYMQLKNFGAAEEAFDEAVSMEPENEWFLDELYGVYIQQDDMRRALKTVKQLVQFHPDYKQDLASLYIRMEKYKDALEILDDMDKNFGFNEDRDYMRNQIYNLTGNDEDRIENLEERVKTNPENEANYLRLIYRYSELGESKKAFDAANRLQTLNPESQMVHLALYKFYLDDNQVQDAIASMKIVFTSPIIQPESKAKVLNDFVKFVAVHQEYETDLIEITAMISEEKSVKTLLELGQYHLQAKEKAKALPYFLEALKQEPKNYAIIKDVLLLKVDLDKNEEAVQMSEEAIDLFPAQPILYLVNAVANNKLKNPKKAIESLETGIDYVIENPNMLRDFYLQLSEAYEQTNNVSKSKSFAQKAEALSTGE